MSGAVARAERASGALDLVLASIDFCLPKLYESIYRYNWLEFIVTVFYRLKFLILRIKNMALVLLYFDFFYLFLTCSRMGYGIFKNSISRSMAMFSLVLPR